MIARLAPTPLWVGAIFVAACGNSSTGARATTDADTSDSHGAIGATADAGSSDDAANSGFPSNATLEHKATEYASYTKLNSIEYPTGGHAGAPLVNVYANSVALATVRSLGSSDAGVTFPVGSMLVKEMLADGGPPILTAIYKNAPGYNAASRDWWYGRLNPDGTPTNPAYVGKVAFCIACHSATPSTDYVYGVPAADQ